MADNPTAAARALLDASNRMDIQDALGNVIGQSYSVPQEAQVAALARNTLPAFLDLADAVEATLNEARVSGMCRPCGSRLDDEGHADVCPLGRLYHALAAVIASLKENQP